MRLFLILFPALTLSANWPQWRGPHANGLSDEPQLPVHWKVLWKTPLPGLGTSTPIVWADQIFLTSQLGDAPFEQRGRDFENSVSAKKTGARQRVEFLVQSFSRHDGKLRWEYRLPAEGDLPAVHMKHNLASPSCLTDGERVYAWFGTGQVLALSLDGKLVWSRNPSKDYGPFQILWGHGSSATLYKDSLLLLCDHQGLANLL